MSGPWNPSNVPPPTQPVPPVPPSAVPPAGVPAETTVSPTTAPPGAAPPGAAPQYVPPGTAAGYGGYGGPPQPPGQPAGSGGRSALVIVAVVLAVLILVTAIGAGAFLLGRRHDNSTKTAESTSTTTTTTTTTTPTTAPTTETTVEPTTAPTTTALGDVRTQPAGLFCRDLRAKGFSYTAAVDYWRIQGQPNQLDADKDGIPCETVYPTADVLAYWGTLGVTPTLRPTTVYDLPPGLLCKDLRDRGFDVYDAIAYYLNWGEPPNMDADGNGVPCETVYSDAWDVWFGTGD